MGRGIKWRQNHFWTTGSHHTMVKSHLVSISEESITDEEKYNLLTILNKK